MPQHSAVLTVVYFSKIDDDDDTILNFSVRVPNSVYCIVAFFNCMICLSCLPALRDIRWHNIACLC